MLVPNRHSSSDSYRYGFQGQEKDDEIKGEGNSFNYTFRMHDPRVGRFFAVDPLFKSFPWNSSYSFCENKILQFSELEGAEINLFTMAKMGMMGKPAMQIANGLEKSVNKTIDGIVFICQNPEEALKGAGNLLLTSAIYGSGAPHSNNDVLSQQLDYEFGTSTYLTKIAIQKSIAEGANKLVNGDLEDKTEVLSDIILSVVSSKGADKVIKGIRINVNVISSLDEVANATKNYANYGGEFIDDFARLSDESATVNSATKGLQALKTSLSNLPSYDRATIMKAIDENMPSLRLKGQSPDGRFMHWEQINGDIKVRIDPPDAQTPYDHIHIYDSKGNSLDINLEIGDRTSPSTHIPIKPNE